MKNQERRFYTTKFEIRAAKDETSMRQIIGHAAVFNRSSQNLGGFVEQVIPGAFAKTIQEADVRALINHDPNLLLGRNKAGTLGLIEDNTGLAYNIDPPDTQVARDWMTSMDRGDINQSSFSFRVIDDEWGLTPEEFPLRALREVALYDVGPVTFPAYLDADSGVSGRSALEMLAEKRSVKLETVLEMAAHNELRDLIKDGFSPVDLAEGREKINIQTEKRDIDPVPGSYEALSDALEDLIEDWAEGQYGTECDVETVATFTNKVVATVYGPGLETDGESFQYNYVTNDDGTYTLGAPTPVDLTVTITTSDDDADTPAVSDMGMNSAQDDAEKRQIEAAARKRRLALLALPNS